MLGSRSFPVSRSGVARLFATLLSVVLLYCHGGCGDEFATQVNNALFPVLEEVTPNTGPIAGGTALTLRGTRFQSDAYVLIDGQAATDVAFLSQAIITCKAPAGLKSGPVNVRVVFSSGYSATLPNGYNYESPPQTAPIPPAPIVVDSVAPATGSLNGGTIVNFKGSGFSPGMAVLFGGVASNTVKIINDSVMTAVAPAHNPGKVDIDITAGANGPTPLKIAGAFEYLAADAVAPMTIASIEPAAGPIAGGSIVNIKGTGFTSGIAVLFGGVAGSDVQVLNDSILTAVVPAGSPGKVDIALNAGQFGPATATKTNGYEYYVLPPDDGTDSDGDGLTDVQELTGYDVWVDAFGLGLGVDTFGNITRVTVFSDPQKADTDGDGATDLEEFLYRSDPTKVDSDGDGLTDGEEIHRWNTSPISVDTDHDARGVEGNRPPNPALFDGRELYTASEILKPSAQRVVRVDGTSPTLDDTDGDGKTDYEELGDPVRKPTLADLPQAQIDIVDNVDVRLFVEYEESQGTEKEYSVSMAQTTSTTLSQSDSVSTSNTIEASVTVGFQAGTESNVHADATAGVSFTNEGSTEWSSESSTEAQQEFSQSQSDSLTQTETSSRGELRMGMLIRNTGNIAFNLTNLAVIARQFVRDPNPLVNNGTYRTIGTLQPVLPNFTLAPGATTNVIEVSATDVNPQLIKQFLANPTSLSLKTAGFELENADGINFTFLTENTYTRTALIIIDYGDGSFDKYRVATNVNRDANGEFTGITVNDAFSKILKVGYTTVPNTNGDNELVLNSITRKDGSVLASGQGLTKWIVFATPSIQLDTDPANPGGLIDFGSLVLHNRDELRLVYIRDDDGDGLTDREELVYGTSDATAHSDRDPNIPGDLGDGLTDYEEIKIGWTVSVVGEAPRQVFSDPRTTDADHDGLNDAQEKALGTDPNLADTDEDGLPDNLDPFPLSPAGRIYVNINAQGANDGSSWANAFTSLHNALLVAGNRNIDADSINDVSEIWVAQGIYRNDGVSRNDAYFLLPNVGIYGGFVGGENKRNKRNPDPLTNGCILSADRGVVGDASDNTFWTVLVDTGNAQSVLDGFTLTDGNADDGNAANTSDFTHGGGGLHWKVFNGQQIRNLFINGNFARRKGGGVMIFRAGGTQDTCTLENCLIAANATKTGHPNQRDGGGGVYVKAGHLILNHCQVNDNETTLDFLNSAGGIHCGENATLTMNNCEVVQNRGTNVGAGGIKVDGTGFARLTNCSIRQNTMAQNGAGGMLLYGKAILVNCDFWSNSNGGSNNTDSSGGLCIGSTGNNPPFTTGDATLVNCTFALNHVESVNTGHAAGVFVYGREITPGQFDRGRVKAYNCIFFGNTGVTLDDETRQIYGSVNASNQMVADITVRTSCIGKLGLTSLPTKFIGFGNIGLDPKFKSLGTGNLQLADDSPCVDLGNNLVDIDPYTIGLQRLPTLDPTDRARIVDGNGDGFPVVDMGAYEVQLPQQ